jgi:hypothetical protein
VATLNHPTTSCGTQVRSLVHEQGHPCYIRISMLLNRQEWLGLASLSLEAPNGSEFERMYTYLRRSLSFLALNTPMTDETMGLSCTYRMNGEIGIARGEFPDSPRRGRR